MKKTYHKKISIFLLVFLAVHQISAQTSLFNVPTSDTLKKRELFFQVQGTLTKEDMETGAVFTWGLGKGFEAGISIKQVTFIRHSKFDLRQTNDEAAADKPEVLINMQK